MSNLLSTFQHSMLSSSNLTPIIHINYLSTFPLISLHYIPYKYKYSFFFYCVYTYIFFFYFFFLVFPFTLIKPAQFKSTFLHTSSLIHHNLLYYIYFASLISFFHFHFSHVIHPFVSLGRGNVPNDYIVRGE